MIHMVGEVMSTLIFSENLFSVKRDKTSCMPCNAGKFPFCEPVASPEDHGKLICIGQTYNDGMLQ